MKKFLKCKNIILSSEFLSDDRFIFSNSLEKRDIFKSILDFSKKSTRKIGMLYGLRRTGKTVLLQQWLMSMESKEIKEEEKSVYILMNGESFDDLKADLRVLQENGYRFIAIDEISMCKDFIDYAAPLSDYFCGKGMKILIAGTDSLALFFASHSSLFDRSSLFHTTHISFAEWCRLTKKIDIDQYLRYGGLLHLEPTEGEDEHTIPLPWVNYEHVEYYFNSSISDNIKNSIRNYRDGNFANELEELLYTRNVNRAIYDVFCDITRSDFYRMLNLLSFMSDEELDSIINSVVAHDKHIFKDHILKRPYRQQDAERVAATVHRKNERIGDIIKNISRRTEKMAEKYLSISNRRYQKVSASEFYSIENYLKLLDVFSIRPVIPYLSMNPSNRERKSYEKRKEDMMDENIVIQPGLRFMQADMTLTLLKNTMIEERIPLEDIELIENLFLNNVFGLLQEDVVLYETMQECKRTAGMNLWSNDRLRYFSLPICAYKGIFPAFSDTNMDKEIDMIICDRRNIVPEYYLFEIKHSKYKDINQQKWLLDSDIQERLTYPDGVVVGKIVLYLGDESQYDENEIMYSNAEKFLIDLHYYGLDKVLDTIRISR